MRHIVYSLTILLFVSCQKENQGLDIEIISKEIISYGHNDECYGLINYSDKSKSIVTYTITNNDNVTYYFNKDLEGELIKSVKGIANTTDLSLLIIKTKKEI